MRKVITIILFLILPVLRSWSQAPQFVHQATTSGNANNYPFGALFHKAQYLYESSKFPTATSGLITKVYFKSNATTASSIISNLNIKIGTTSLTAFPTTTYETTGLVTAFSSASYSVSATQGFWFAIDLQTPIPYTAGSNLLVEVSKTGISGGAISIYHTGETYNSRIASNSATATTGTASTLLAEFGMDITPLSGATIAGADTVCLGSNSTFVGAPGGGTWSSSNTTVGTINASGVLTELTQGSTTLTYVSGSTSATKTVFVKPPVNLMATITANPNDTVCPGTNIILTGSSAANIPVTYQWRYNNITPSSSATWDISNWINVNNPGTYSCSLIVNNTSLACALPDTATVQLHIYPSPSASVSITSDISGTPCVGTNVTFTATPTNGGTNPVYQWKKKNNNVGTNSATYSDATLTAIDEIHCEMVSSLASTCITSTPVVSNSIILPLVPNVNPTAVLTLDQSAVCEGVQVTATAVVNNQGNAPQYSWYLNNNLIINTGLTYSFTPSNNDNIFFVLTSNALCASNTVIHSDTLDLVATATPSPVVTLNNGVLTSSIVTGNQWYQGINVIAGATNQTYTPTVDGIYHVVATSNNCSGTSNSINYQGTLIKKLELGTLLSIYPNPATDIINIENLSTYNWNQVVITNILGQCVLVEKLNAVSKAINVASLPAGLYNVKFMFNEGEVNRKLNLRK